MTREGRTVRPMALQRSDGGLVMAAKDIARILVDRALPEPSVEMLAMGGCSTHFLQRRVGLLGTGRPSRLRKSERHCME